MANSITIGRVLLLFGAIGMIYTESYWLVFLAGWLIAIVFLGDGVDGWVARKRGSTSKFGAVFDIAGDRVVENVLWVVFAHLQMVPIWAPLVVITRSFSVDAVRAAALEQGFTPFGESTMMRSSLTRFLTSSRLSRAYYGWSKALAFVFLTWLFAWELPDADGRFLDVVFDYQAARFVVWFLAYSSLALCVIRGLPVFYDSIYYLRADQPGPEPSTAGERERGPLTPEASERGRPV
jgi:CDP-diacylglycerol--glycerol-3-phosphate 3-phosphatidyltransferase